MFLLLQLFFVNYIGEKADDPKLSVNEYTCI